MKIGGASVDPINAADFKAVVSFTQDSIGVNFADLAPASGHTLVIHMRSTEPGSVLVLGTGVAGLVWGLRRGHPAKRVAIQGSAR